MAKLTKHAEVLTQLHSMVKKQAEEAQKNISGTPGGDVKAVSVSDEHETTNKNSVGPENVAQGYSQKPSEDSSEPLAGSKSASDLGAEILDLIRKQAEAQASVDGGPNSNNAESVSDEQENVDKNAVKPENNKQNYAQKGSTDSSKPLSSAKQASEVETLASKVASYELGRQFCAALLKAAGTTEQDSSDVALMKEAGRRDFDLLISQAAEDLELSEKVAELEEAESAGADYLDALLDKASEDFSLNEAEHAGAAYFEDVLKQAAFEETAAENEQLKAKLAEFENFFKQAEAEQAAEAYQAKLASSVAATVLDKLKTEVVSGEIK
jgi:ribosomal protein L13E